MRCFVGDPLIVDHFRITHLKRPAPIEVHRFILDGHADPRLQWFVATVSIPYGTPFQDAILLDT